MTQAWQDGWFATGIKTLAALLWRGVEAQHHVATMKLVDLLLARMFAVSDTVWLALGAVVDAAPVAVKPVDAVSVVLEVAAVDPAERLVGSCRSSA